MVLEMIVIVEEHAPGEAADQQIPRTFHPVEGREGVVGVFLDPVEA